MYLFSGTQTPARYDGKTTLIKDAIRVGTYIHPVHKWQLAVDEAKLSHWVETFKKMKEAGVTVPFVGVKDSGGGDHTVNSSTTMSYVKDMFVADGVLSFTVEVDEKDKEFAKKINQVSIGTKGTFTDGKGNVYKDAIQHIALTPTPIVPGQEGFKELALATGVDEVLVLEEPEKPSEKPPEKPVVPA